MEHAADYSPDGLWLHAAVWHALLLLVFAGGYAKAGRSTWGAFALCAAATLLLLVHLALSMASAVGLGGGYIDYPSSALCFLNLPLIFAAMALVLQLLSPGFRDERIERLHRRLLVVATSITILAFLAFARHLFEFG
jgi:hypothetical protein